MKILVTGGAGFIGSAVIRHIIHNTNDIVDRDGWFIYQSLSGSVPYGSTFGGSLTFVVNKDREDHSNNGHPQTTFSMASTGTFEVAVPTFVLSSQEYYY